jgi:uncharacterized membrane protein
MPVCARCTGIYFGAAIAAAIQVARGLQPSVNRGVAPRAPERLALCVATARVMLAFAALPSAATLVYEWTTGVMPSNALRFAAGIPLGVVVAWLVVSAAENQVN